MGNDVPHPGPVRADEASAVFASSFRTWVLFNYSKNDIPYTLAPLLAWSAIEMAAGIISACLPTMRPLLRIVTSKVSRSKLLSFSRTGGTQSLAGHDTSNGRNSTSQGMSQSGGSAAGGSNVRVAPETLQASAVSTRRNDSPAFYRLPEGIEMGGVFIEEVERASFDKSRSDTKMTFYEEDSGQDSGREGDEQSQDGTHDKTMIMRVWRG